jgi:hypothetical protein
MLTLLMVTVALQVSTLWWCTEAVSKPGITLRRAWAITALAVVAFISVLGVAGYFIYLILPH